MADNYCKCCGDGTPEYIIELNQQGAPGKRGEKGEQGYSPIVDFIVDDNEIRFTSTNENNITSTPNLYDYVLKKDGSNATDTFRLNKIRFITNNNTAQRMYSLDSTGLNLSGNPLRLDGEAYASIAYPNRIIISNLGQDITLGNTDKANIIINNDKATYNGNELATVNNISNSKITISQGDVVKGSFTLNQSGDTTIELDTGVTNPLKIEGATVDNPSGGTVTYGMELGLDSNNKVYLDYTREFKVPGGINTIKEPIIENNKVVGLTAVENSISELTTLADNTEASLNELKTDYETNKTEVAEELTTLGNQINTKASKTELDELADTKNDNIFDIGKFTVVGSPTITDDGVASGFSHGNYLITPKIDLSTANSWTIITPWFSFSDLQDRKDIISADYITTNGGNIYVILNDSKHIEMRVAYQNWSSFLAPADITNIVVNKKYQTKIEFTGTRYNFYYRSEDNMNWTQTSDGGFMSNTKIALNNVFGVGVNQNGTSVATNTSIDLKQFSITVDGKEAFNSWMNSTVPIYNQLTTTNNTLSTFKTDTTNNFSAVNSALNEKANLSDLANYVPLTTYNALLARVEALEAEINGGNA